MPEETVSLISVNEAPQRVNILGFPVDCVSMEQTVKILEGFLSSEKTRLVFTADSNAFINAETQDGYRRLFEEADLITPDSAGPVWALGKYGHPVPGRVSGVDLLERLCEISQRTKCRMFFLGSSPGVAEQARQNLLQKYPGCEIIGARDGFFKKEQDAEIAEEISKLKPDVLVVAMGMPRQELFILDTADIIKAKIGIGVGGSLDVHSGSVKRAPLLIQKIKMEWLWRLILNPKKFDKVRNLPTFYLRVRKATK